MIVGYIFICCFCSSGAGHQDVYGSEDQFSDYDVTNADLPFINKGIRGDA